LVESRLLDGIKRDLLAPEIVAAVRREVQGAVERMRTRAKPDGARMAQLSEEVANLTEAIASGMLKSSPAIGERLNQAEGELRRLQVELSTPPEEKVAQLVPRIADRWRAVVENLGNVALEDVAHARTQVRALIGSVVTLLPSEDKSYLNAHLGLEVAALISNSATPKSVVAGTRFCPRRRLRVA
jgi:hypothetical protein